jgi:hypothetical protein
MRLSNRAILQEEKDAVRPLDRAEAKVVRRWSVVWSGDGYDGPTGPWASEENAETAVDRWYQGGGWRKNWHRMRVAEIADRGHISQYADFVVIKACQLSLYWDHDQ